MNWMLDMDKSQDTTNWVSARDRGWAEARGTRAVAAPQQQHVPASQSPSLWTHCVSMSRQVAELNSTMQTQREAAQQLQQQLDTAQANWQQAQQAANQLEAQLHHCTSAAAAQQQHMEAEVTALRAELQQRDTDLTAAASWRKEAEERLLRQEAEMTALSVRHKQEKAFLQARCEGQVSVVTQLRQQLKDRTAAEQRLVEQVAAAEMRIKQLESNQARMCNKAETAEQQLAGAETRVCALETDFYWAQQQLAYVQQHTVVELQGALMLSRGAQAGWGAGSMRSSSSSSASEFEDLQWHCQEQAAARDALAVELQQTKVAQAQASATHTAQVAQLQAQLQTLRDLEAGTVRLWRSRVRELKAQLTDLQAQYGEQSDLVEQLEDELQALAEGRQGIKALDLLLLSLQQRDTTEEQRAAAAGTVDLIYRRHKQLHALLTSHEFGEGGVPGCAAAALCCFFVWGRVSSSKELGAVYRRLSQIVHSDGVRVLGDEEETKMLNAMEDRLSLLL